jgi:hypothetical protein
MQLYCAPPQVSSALPIEIVVKMVATISMKLRNEQGDVFVKKLPKDNEKLPKKSPNHVFVRFTI